MKLKHRSLEDRIEYYKKMVEQVSDPAALLAISDLASEIERLRKEKERRLYYQDIVYAVCVVVEKSMSITSGNIVTGTVEHPSTELQDKVEKLRRRAAALDRLDRFLRKNEAEVYWDNDMEQFVIFHGPDTYGKTLLEAIEALEEK